MIAIIVALLVLVFAMVGCGPTPDPKPKGIKVSEALGNVLGAANNTIGTIKSSSGDIGLGLTIGVKVDKFKMDNDDLNVHIGETSFDAKVKIGANLSKTANKIEGLAEVIVGEQTKFGIYTKENVVYIQDAITKATAQKLKVSGAADIEFNNYITQLPDILINALKGVDLTSIQDLVTGAVGDALESLFEVKKETDGSYNLRVILKKEGDRDGLAAIMPLLSDVNLGVFEQYLPIILGGTFKDFTDNKVTKTSQINLSVGIKNDKLTGVKISIDLNDLETTQGVAGKIDLEIGNLIVESSAEADIGMPADLGSYQEGALTAELALDIPNNDKLKFKAKIEFSPSLTDEDMKVSVIAQKLDGQDIAHLKAAYTEVEPGKYGIVFDMGYLYEVAGLTPPAEGTVYKYELNIGEFLLNLIKKQRSFVFFDEMEGGFYSGAKYYEFFQENGDNFTAQQFKDVIPEIQAYYVDKFGGEADDYVVKFRNPDGTLLMNADGTGFDPYVVKGTLGFNFECTAVVSVKNRETYTGNYDRDYVEMTFKDGPDGDKTVLVRTGDFVDFAPFAPEYTVPANSYFKCWSVGGVDYTDLYAVEVTANADVEFVTEPIGENVVVNYNRYNIETGAFEVFNTAMYPKVQVSSTGTVGDERWELPATTDGFRVEGGLPEVPEIPGMKGSWIVVSARGHYWRNTYSSIQVMSNNVTDYSADVGTAAAAKAVDIYPFYEIDKNYDWTQLGEFNELDYRFTRKTLNDGKVTSIVEQGDPSKVGFQIGLIVANIKEIFGIVGSQTVDLDFVAGIAGEISPYLGTKELLAARIRNILSPVEIENPVAYPYVMPTLLKKDNATEINTAVDLFALTEGESLIDKGDKTSVSAGIVSGWSSRHDNVRSGAFLDRCYYAVVYATRQRFIEKFGNLDDAAIADLCWTANQQTSYRNATTALAKAQAYVANEEASYGRKVEAAEEAIAEAVQGSETKALQAIGGYLGAGAVEGCNTVCDFLFGTSKNDPLQISLEFAAPEGNDGMNVSLIIKRKSAAATEYIAKVSGQVFFSLASGINPPTFEDAELENAIDVTTGSILGELADIAAALGQGGNNQGSGDAE